MAHFARMWPAYAFLLAYFTTLGILHDRLAKAIESRRRIEFRASCDLIRNRGEVQVTLHTALLSGMRGFLAARENVTPAEFGRYLAGLGLAPRNGLRDVGFAMRVPHDTRHTHTLSMRANGFTNYTPNFSDQAQEHFPVAYLNDFALGGMTVSGWDIAWDPIRLATLERARDTGEATATPPVILNARDPSRRAPGVVVYLPVYAGGNTPPELEGRRTNLIGFTFASFATQPLWSAIESAGNPVARVQVFDGGDLSVSTRIYPGPETLRTRENADWELFETVDQLGRVWGLRFLSRAAFEASPGRYAATLIGALGALLGLGLFAFAWVLIQSRWNAERLAGEISASEARFRRLFDSVQDVYYRTDVDGCVQIASPSCRSVLGYDPNEIVGRSVLETYVDPGARRTVIERLLVHERIADHELLLRHKDGHPIHVSLTAQLLRDEQGRPAGTEGYLRDISARKLAEAEQLRASKLESVGLLAGGIAHDFNNILTAILGNVALLRPATPGAPGPEQDDPLAEVERAALRARGLTQQLLTFARGGAPVRQTASLADIFRETVTFALRGSAVGHEFELPSDLWLAQVDAAQIHSVVHNISLNAVQAMPAGGTLIVRARNVAPPIPPSLDLPPGPYVCCSLTDTGPGIPEDILPRIFDPYFTTKRDGNGLGLATAYSIIRRHGGRLTVESKEGEGTTFHLWLPASPEAVVPPTQGPAPERSGSGTILVLDDEPSIRTILGRSLRRLGYECLAVADGEAALEALRARQAAGESPVRAAILDLTIPGGMGGLETLPRLRELQPGLPAIVSSGYSSDPIMSNHRSHGFDAILPKPYQTGDLARALEEILPRGGAQAPGQRS